MKTIGIRQKIQEVWHRREISKLEDLFFQAAQEAPSNQLLLSEENSQNLLSFLASLNLVGVRRSDEPFDICAITSLLAGRPHPFNVKDVAFDILEKLYFVKHLKQYVVDIRQGEIEWQKLSAYLRADVRPHMLAGHPDIQKFQWAPERAVWSNADGSHRTFKLRFLSKLLNKDWKFQAHISSFSINTEKALEFCRDNWFLLPDNPIFASEIFNLIREIIGRRFEYHDLFPALKRRYPSRDRSYNVGELDFASGSFTSETKYFDLMKLPSDLLLPIRAKRQGLFFLNSFITELLLRQQQNSEKLLP